MRRDRVLRDLAGTADDTPLILVVAPAGYGKTTTLGQWATEDRREFGWLRIEDADNDPLRLLRHIALALHRMRPIDYAAWNAMAAPDAPLFEVVLPRLIAATTASGPPWVLVLDDIQTLQGGLRQEAVIAFAESLPPGFHLVVAGRHQPGLKLSALRSQGRCVEFGAAELAFTEDETREALKTAGIPFADGDVEQLMRRTEGWPAGVYLATVSAREGSELELVFDYLREEVLHQESAETVRFLTRTAPLRRLSGPLCDAVLGSTCSAARLAEVESRNLFIVPEDAREQSYRYHPLFRELLLSDLRRREPDEEVVVHRRAARWYDEHRYGEQAVLHALDGRDPTQAARLVTRYGDTYLNTGRLHAVPGWLQELSAGELADHPPLAVFAGWIWALTGDPARAHECLRASEGRGSVAAGVARLRAALAPFGVERMLADARTAYDLEVPGGSWYPLSAMLLGVAALLNGDPWAARGLLERAAHFGRSHHGYPTSFALAQLSLLAVDQDDWSVAESCAAEAVDLTLTGQLAAHPFGTAVHVAQARVAVHRGDEQAARDSVAAALRASVEAPAVAFPWLVVQMAIALGRVLLDLDDYPAALHQMAQARRHLARLPSEGVLGRQGQRLSKDLARYDDHHLPSPHPMSLTTAEMRVLQLLPTHLTLGEIADTLFISRNTVKTQVAATYAKLKSSTRSEAVRAAREQRLIE